MQRVLRGRSVGSVVYLVHLSEKEQVQALYCMSAAVNRNMHACEAHSGKHTRGVPKPPANMNPSTACMTASSCFFRDMPSRSVKQRRAASRRPWLVGLFEMFACIASLSTRIFFLTRPGFSHELVNVFGKDARAAIGEAAHQYVKEMAVVWSCGAAP